VQGSTCVLTWHLSGHRARILNLRVVLDIAIGFRCLVIGGLNVRADCLHDHARLIDYVAATLSHCTRFP